MSKRQSAQVAEKGSLEFHRWYRGNCHARLNFLFPGLGDFVSDAKGRNIHSGNSTRTLDALSNIVDLEAFAQ